MRECSVLFIKVYFSVVGCVSVLFLFIKVYFSVVGCLSVMSCVSKYILVLLAA